MSRRTEPAARLLLFLAVALCGCRQPGVEICSGGCPSGQFCDTRLGRCVDKSGSCPKDLGRYLSLAAGDTGMLQAAFYDASRGDLIFASWQADGGMRCETADGGGDDVGLYASLALDRLGRPWIAYFDRSNGRLKLARKTAGKWEAFAVPRSEQQVVGRACRLRLDSNDLPHVAYFNETTGQPELARLLQDGRWIVEPVLAVNPTGWGGSFGGEIGRRLDLVLGGGDQDWIFFVDPAEGALRAAHRQSEGWTLVEIEPGPEAAGWLSAELDPAGNPAVAYHRTRSGELLLAHNRGGTLQRVVLDDGRRQGGQSLTGVHCALRFGSDGLARVLYLDGGELIPYLVTSNRAGGFDPPWRLDYPNPAGFYPALAESVGAVHLALVEYSRQTDGSLAGRIELLRQDLAGGGPP